MIIGREPIRRLLAEVAVAFAFLTRLPVPRLGAAWRRASLADALRFAPVVGSVIAATQTFVLLGCVQVRCPVLTSGTVAVLTSVGLTGALHEDGLADVADSFGGSDRERKLAIMRDSRIGSYGALALVATVLLRSSALADLLGRSGPASAIGALFLAAPCSRALMLLPLWLLSPARSDGMAHSAGAPKGNVVLTSLVLAGLIGAGAVLLTPASPIAAMGAALLAGVASILVTLWAGRTYGGVTGDVVGASQQVTETMILLALSSGH